MKKPLTFERFYSQKSLSMEELAQFRAMQDKNLKGALSFFLSAKESDLEKIINTDSHPIVMKIIASILLKAASQGDYKAFDSVIDRLIGKPGQAVSLEMNYDSKLKEIPMDIISKRVQELHRLANKD